MDAVGFVVLPTFWRLGACVLSFDVAVAETAALLLVEGDEAFVLVDAGPSFLPSSFELLEILNLDNPLHMMQPSSFPIS